MEPVVVRVEIAVSASVEGFVQDVLDWHQHESPMCNSHVSSRYEYVYTATSAERSIKKI